MDKLLHVMRRLRDPDNGCPWDKVQDFRSIAPYTVEEAYEVADAIERGDMQHLKEELGDLLFQVVYHAQMANEIDEFAFEDVVTDVTDKLIRRHPHVFGEQRFESEAQVKHSWEAIKAEERMAKAEDPDEHSVLDDVPVTLPGLNRAVKLQKRAARIGFDWDDTASVIAKIREELGEVEAELEGGDHDALEDELGDLLFAVSNLARHLNIDPETAVRRTCYKFERRFRGVEKHFRDTGKPIDQASLDEMEMVWQSMKRREK